MTSDEFDTALMNLISTFHGGVLVTDYVVVSSVVTDNNDNQLWTYAPPTQRTTSSIGLLNAASMVISAGFLAQRYPDSG